MILKIPPSCELNVLRRAISLTMSKRKSVASKNFIVVNVQFRKKVICCNFVDIYIIKSKMIIEFEWKLKQACSLVELLAGRVKISVSWAVIPVSSDTKFTRIFSFSSKICCLTDGIFLTKRNTKFLTRIWSGVLLSVIIFFKCHNLMK